MIYSEACLTQVFSHLVSNALKFTDGKAPAITIGCEDYPEYYRLIISDNGIGIEPRFQEKVFGLFNQLNPDIDGTGIGLALVKRIVEVHGGEIWIESEGIGQGSTFYFTLPFAAAKG